MNQKNILTIKGSKKLTQYNITGIYFLIKDNVIVYIGKAFDISSRIRAHIIEDKKDFDEIRYVEKEIDDLDLSENYYISLYNPKYNKTHSQKCENYNRYLKGDYLNLRLKDIVEFNEMEEMKC